jgi:DNA-binding GntR family transcriptional regulator
VTPCEAHRGLVTAFRKRQPETAVEIATRHLNATMAAIEQLSDRLAGP